MKAFIVVSLVCYLGAASAGLTSPPGPLVKTSKGCRQQAYSEILNCTKYGFNDSTAELQCLSATVFKYIKCIENTAPIVSGAELHSLGGNLTDIEKSLVEKFKCIFNIMLDTVKCIINDQKSTLKYIRPVLQTSKPFKDIDY